MENIRVVNIEPEETEHPYYRIPAIRTQVYT